ncbi:hypothetical protein [Arthrobacter mobilis]|uniref:Uncharacterized protein n=1 Tax=Arthrobacter mobilis TaxID=2724944 RepID=A0A7X6K7A1_9MICC|nr:hypothetical protein [Arthrobacter mobilis]NKX56473.1 hypothetical protein [Arthrobacter mobilis]
MPSRQQPIRRRTALGLALVAVPPALWWAAGGRGPAPFPVGPHPGPAGGQAATMACWGSSTVAGISAYMEPTAAAYNMRYFNGGAGGQTAEQILARLGSRPARMDGGIIPASGSVVLTTGSMSAADHAPFAAAGTLAGIPGTLVKPPGARSGYRFTRHRPGHPRRIAAGTPFLPDKGTEFRTGINHLNIGKNNLTGRRQGTTDPETIIDWTIGACEWISAAGGQVLVWGHFVNTYTPESRPVRERIVRVNLALKERYGSRFVDVQALVTSFGIWAQAGLLPSWADLQQQARGNKPPGLSGDRAHLNEHGYEALRQLADGRMRELGWVPPAA